MVDPLMVVEIQGEVEVLVPGEPERQPAAVGGAEDLIAFAVDLLDALEIAPEREPAAGPAQAARGRFAPDVDLHQMLRLLLLAAGADGELVVPRLLPDVLGLGESRRRGRPVHVIGRTVELLDVLELPAREVDP